jgi:hypothetical protein
MNGADYDTELFTELARASTMTQRQRINAELMPTDTGDTRTGTGLDGRALELVSAILAIDGELYTDGECLDVIGRIVDAWRGIQL